MNPRYRKFIQGVIHNESNLDAEDGDDEDYVKALSSVILDQALIQEGVMPSDPAAFAAELTKLLSECSK